MLAFGGEAERLPRFPHFERGGGMHDLRRST